MAATEALVELQKLRETAESLRRVAVGLPAELRTEIERVARQLDHEADDLEVKLRSL
jgi:hypothetical protein